MPKVRSQGLTIHYEVIGEGPPLLLHHGVMGRGAMWADAGYLASLGSEFTFILMDARGHGQSDKPHMPAAYGGPELARDIIAVMDDLRFDQVIYWGYSLGGRVGFELAQIAPDRVSAFIIGGSSPYAIDLRVPVDGDPGDPAAVQAAVLSFFGMSAETLPPLYKDAILANDFLAVHACLAKRPSIENALANMTMPCLIYVGEHDPRSQPAERAAGKLTNATFVRLSGLDHSQAVMLREPVMPHARRFLGALETGCPTAP